MIARKKWLRLLPLLVVLAGVEVYWYTKQAEVVLQKPQPLAAEAQSKRVAPTIRVKHSLQGDDLHLALTVTHFRYSFENMGKENRYGEGHVHLYLDDKKVAKIFEDTYVYRDIPKGKHQVMVELAHNNHESYGVKQAFTIEVK